MRDKINSQTFGRLDPAVWRLAWLPRRDSGCFTAFEKSGGSTELARFTAPDHTTRRSSKERRRRYYLLEVPMLNARVSETLVAKRVERLSGLKMQE